MNNKNKKILIFSLSYLPKMVGGAEVAIKEITDRLENVEFSMITLRYDSALPRHEKIGNVHIYRVGFSRKNSSLESLVSFPMYLNKIFYPILAIFKAYFLDRKEKFDGFWSMMIFMSLPSMFFNFFFRKVPYLISIQEGDDIDLFLNRWFVKPFKFLILRALYQANSVQCISNFLADWIRRLGYVGPLVVIPNGVDLEVFKLGQEELDLSQKLRKEIGFGDSDVVINTTSRLVYKNGVDTLIKSLTHLDEKFKLIVVGDGPLRGELEELVKNLNLGKRVFFAGQKTKKDIPIYLFLSSVFCRPSRTEGQGNAFLEASSCGIPVLGTDVGGIGDFIKDKETGLFFKVDDPEDLALKIKDLFSNEKLRKDLILNARRLVEKKYDWVDLTLRMFNEFFGRI